MRIPVFLIIYVDGLRGDVVDHGCGRLHLRRRFASLGTLVRFHIEFARHAPAIIAFEWKKFQFVVFVVHCFRFFGIVFALFLVVRTHSASACNRARHSLVQYIEPFVFELHDVKKFAVDQNHRWVVHGFENFHFGTTRRHDFSAVAGI